MRMGIDKDVGRGPVLAEDGEDAVDIAPFLAPGIEFSVGIGAGSSLTETIVALAIHPLLPGNQCEVLLPFSHILASLEYDGPQAEFYQSECRKKATGSLTHNNHGFPFRHIGVIDGSEGRILWGLVHIDPYHQVDEDGALTGIDAPAQHTDSGNGSLVDSEFLCHSRLDGGCRGCHLWQYSQLDIFVHSFLFVYFISYPMVRSSLSFHKA